MKLLIASLYCAFFVTVQSLQYRAVEEYYWRDFNGLIPSDAIKGGKDENGQNTYIAQFTTIAAYNSAKAPLHTVPAVVKVGQRYAFAPYSGKVLRSNETSNTKILCGNEYRYKWFSPTTPISPNCRYVIGGNEDGFIMFVGRANHNKEVVIGKIFSDNTNHRTGLISAYNGIEVFHDNFEVLTHCS